jgi:hypothetical protein
MSSSKALPLDLIAYIALLLDIKTIRSLLLCIPNLHKKLNYKSFWKSLSDRDFKFTDYDGSKSDYIRLYRINLMVMGMCIKTSDSKTGFTLTKINNSDYLKLFSLNQYDNIINYLTNLDIHPSKVLFKLTLYQSVHDNGKSENNNRAAIMDRSLNRIGNKISYHIHLSYYSHQKYREMFIHYINLSSKGKI